jgi:hypothetical protein
MGDFEDIFGEGADIESIIDGICEEYSRESARLARGATRRKRDKNSYQDELDAWRNSMISRGYTKGPQFSTYEELSAWDRENKRPHIRRRNGCGFEVFFTDRQSSQPFQSKGAPKTDDDEIPF